MKFAFIGFFVIGFAIKCVCQQLVLRGDHADPSVVKIGDTYWASATTSNWFPAYPLLKSRDLINWKTEGFVFNKIPAWADYYFWAPEISCENGKVYIYYSAHKKDGNLCLSVASADKPTGPYTDHGPLMCEEAGSIDAFPMRDEKGKLFIIWKEDGNSVNKPTPIWAQEMNEQRTALIGNKQELFRNDKGWEGNLIEGVSMMKKGDYYYAFYAAAACCGRECTYQTGIARSKNLLGPWEKYDNNPILTNDDEWKCPGHGTPVEKNGRYYFLYHAYDKSSDVFTGREGLLIEFKFTTNGWVEFIKENKTRDVPLVSVTDNFSSATLSRNWQWSVFQETVARQERGELSLMALPSQPGAYLGIKTTSGKYTAIIEVKTGRTTASAGIGVIGDDKNTISALFDKGELSILQLRDGTEKVIQTQKIKQGSRLFLQLHVSKGKDLKFLYSVDGTNYRKLNDQAVDGSYLPPWDRSVRVGLISKGDSSLKATFDNFRLINR